jgi:hypothetical protein
MIRVAPIIIGERDWSMIATTLDSIKSKNIIHNKARINPLKPK